MQTRLKTIRWLFQFLGAAVCILFAVQGGVAFTNSDNVQTFWDRCHWISEASLYILVGVVGCVMELRVFFPQVRLHLHNFAANRLVMSGVYLWMGCYSMEGQVALSEDWEAIRRVSGIVSWFVGVSNVLISCCSDRAERLYNESQTAKDGEAPGTRAPTSDQAVVTKYGSASESPSTSPVQQDMKSVSDWDCNGAKLQTSLGLHLMKKDEAETTEVPANPFVDSGDAEAPRGGWASVGSKPFGAG